MPATRSRKARRPSVRQRLTFLYGDLWHGVPLPPLEVEVDRLVGPVVRTFIAEPLHDPVPPADKPKPVGKPAREHAR